MKSSIYTFFTMVFISLICSGQNSTNLKSTEGNPSKVYKGPIIDMHLHAYGEGNPLFGTTHPPTLRGETFQGVSSPEEQKIKTLEKMRKHNIVKAMVTAGHLWISEAPETIMIGRDSNSMEELRKLYKEGQLQVIAEVAPFYEGKLADDPSMLPYFELAQELDIPIGFHILPGGPNNGFHLMPEMLGGMRSYNAKPTQLENVMVKYPKLKVYIMHGGWPYVEDLKALMYAHSNVYVDISVLNWLLPQTELNNYLKALIDSGFGSRIMFGTDQIVWPDTIDVAVESVNAVEFLTMQQKEDIFYNNAARFLGLTNEEINKHKLIGRKKADKY